LKIEDFKLEIAVSAPEGAPQFAMTNDRFSMINGFCFFVSSVSLWLVKKVKSDQAARPISIGPLNGLLHLYAQPINLVVFQGS
jgi:hypothetical protein